MADESDDIEDETEGEEAPKKNPLKLVLFIGLPVLILLLAGVGGFMMFAGGGDDEEQHADAGHGEAGDGHDAADTHETDEVYYYDLREGDGTEETIVTNIRSSTGRPVVIQMSVSFESRRDDLGPILEQHVDRVLDQYLMFLRELREDDIYGSAGQNRLRLELLRRVNLAIEPAQVDAVLITQILMVD
ncbi:flagellar basal body-associated FliL family protein [uncultured Maricaulis sp.]|uniref:flagellar basal body-associated FliL family protein n=1 Tax=uncultured Maricaulis sp. TaxID=174710 RepID=UPI002633A4D3|nr:flagellar basal body-associated FliL family protein [uncultured Maricaulis sp.]